MLGDVIYVNKCFTVLCVYVYLDSIFMFLCVLNVVSTIYKVVHRHPEKAYWNSITFVSSGAIKEI